MTFENRVDIARAMVKGAKASIFTVAWSVVLRGRGLRSAKTANECE